MLLISPAMSVFFPSISYKNTSFLVEWIVRLYSSATTNSPQRLLFSFFKSTTGMFLKLGLVRELLRSTLLISMIAAPSLGSSIVASQTTTSSLETSNSVALALIVC
jgi:hypothetical protein